MYQSIGIRNLDFSSADNCEWCSFWKSFRASEVDDMTSWLAKILSHLVLEDLLMRSSFATNLKATSCDSTFAWIKTTSRWFQIIGLTKRDGDYLIYLTLNRPGFLESSTAGVGGGADSAPLCNFHIWRPMTMKFGHVILRQQLYQEIIEHLMTSLLWRFHNVILYFRLCLGKRNEKILIPLFIARFAWNLV